MIKSVRIGLITVIVTFGILTFLHIPIALPPTDSVGISNAEAIITLAQRPDIHSQSQPMVEDNRNESTFKDVLMEEIQVTNNLSQPDWPTVERIETVGNDASFIPDVDIASVKVNHTPQKSEDHTMANQTYVSLSQVTEAPQFDRKLLSSRIVYPQGAKRQGVEATVALRLYIGDDGTIEDIIVQEDPGHGFAAAAIQAFTDLIIQPAKIDGMAVAVTMVFPITFSLQ